MKRLMILLALVAGMAFAGCSDDDSLAEQNAKRILSYNRQVEIVADYLPAEKQKVYANLAIEIPYLVLKEGETEALIMNLNDLKSIDMVYEDGELHHIKLIFD